MSEELIERAKAWIAGQDFPGISNFIIAPSFAREIVAALAASGIATLKDEVPDNSEEIARALDEGAGFWKHCTGCIGTDNPRSKVFRCEVGMGCRECGGLGILWDSTDYDAMARDMLAADAEERTLKDRADQLAEALKPFADWAEHGPSREYLRSAEDHGLAANTPHNAGQYRAALSLSSYG